MKVELSRKEVAYIQKLLLASEAINVLTDVKEECAIIGDIELALETAGKAELDLCDFCTHQDLYSARI